MQTVNLKLSGAQTAASATGETVSVGGGYTDAVFVLDVTALATETADKLDVYIDVSPNGTDWYNIVHFTQQDGDGSAATLVAKIAKGHLLDDGDANLAITADAAEGVVRNLFLGDLYRYRSAITDASTDNASFTFSVKGIFA